MKKLLLLSLLAFQVNANSGKDIMKFLFDNKDADIFQDLIDKRQFSPPYDNLSYFNKLASMCYEHMGSSEFKKSFVLIVIKDDILSTIAGGSEDTIIGQWIDKSGGSIALHEYVSSEFLYLMNARNRLNTSKAAKKLRDQFRESPQYKKIKTYSSKILAEIESDKNKNENTSRLFDNSATAICFYVDFLYAALGGKKYSHSLQVIQSTRKQIHLSTTKSLQEQFEALQY